MGQSCTTLTEQGEAEFTFNCSCRPCYPGYYKVDQQTSGTDERTSREIDAPHAAVAVRMDPGPAPATKHPQISDAGLSEVETTDSLESDSPAAQKIASCPDENKETKDGTIAPAKDVRSVFEDHMQGIVAANRREGRQVEEIGTVEAMAKYAERRQKKKEQRKAQAVDHKIWASDLSNVPEVDLDIKYRFTYIVIGDVAAEVVESACRSGHLGKEAGHHRSMCSVPYPPQEGVSPSLAKLVFRTRRSEDHVPECTSREETLNTCVIAVLRVNASLTSNSTDKSFEEQLWAYERIVEEMRYQERRFRPARALIICYDGPEPADEAWLPKIEALEEIEGPIWRFGPMDVNDGEAFSRIFSTIASTRIVRSQKSDGAESEGSHISLGAPLWEVEREIN